MLILKNLTADLMGKTIVKQFNLQLKLGEVACLYGSSGCGKTTILRLIAGIIEAESGYIENQFAYTAYLFQEHRLLPWKNAWENIALVCKHANSAGSKQRIAALLQRLALDESDWHKYPHELSGGMRQRVALGRALITQPQLLLMDEPFSALDIELKCSLTDLILKPVQQAKMSIILVTHDRHEALRLAHKIYILTDKKPTKCQQIIDLSVDYGNRDLSFVESYLSQDFWNIR